MIVRSLAGWCEPHLTGHPIRRRPKPQPALKKPKGPSKAKREAARKKRKKRKKR